MQGTGKWCPAIIPWLNTHQLDYSSNSTEAGRMAFSLRVLIMIAGKIQIDMLIKFLIYWILIISSFLSWPRTNANKSSKILYALTVHTYLLSEVRPIENRITCNFLVVLVYSDNRIWEVTLEADHVIETKSEAISCKRKRRYRGFINLFN